MTHYPYTTGTPVAPSCTLRSVGRGLGSAQRAALVLLTDATERDEGIYVAALAQALDLTARRAHQLTDSLRERGLVWTKIRGWRNDDGMPGRGMIVFLGDPPLLPFGERLDRHGRVVR